MRKKRRELADACSLLRDCGRECIRNRLAAKSRGEPLRDDVLSLMMERRDRYDTEEEILDEFVTFFIAGMVLLGNKRPQKKVGVRKMS